MMIKYAIYSILKGLRDTRKIVENCNDNAFLVPIDQKSIGCVHRTKILPSCFVGVCLYIK